VAVSRNIRRLLLPAIACGAFALHIGILAPDAAIAQGMISVEEPAQPEDTAPRGSGSAKAVTIQRLLARLGYLDGKLSRQLDSQTIKALAQFLAAEGLRLAPTESDEVIRALFTAAWKKENWASGSVKGQELVVSKAEVKEAQAALKTLGYEPGPVDGVFGPATLSSIETFQEDLQVKVDGLLTSNTYASILRALASHGKEMKGEVRVLNWPDYIDPKILQDFERETNVRVIYDVFESYDEAVDVVENQKATYDLVIYSGSTLSSAIEKNRISKIKKEELKGAGNLDPAILGYLRSYDADNSYSIPYLWGTVGLAVNEYEIRRRVPGARLDSLGLILDETIAEKLADCGIGVVDEPHDVTPAMISFIGADAQAIGLADLEELDRVLSKAGRFMKRVSAAQFVESLKRGEFCVAFGYSGDILQARDAIGNDKRKALQYLVPFEGSLLWFDILVMPNGVKNPQFAHAFLEYLLKPEVAGAITNYVRYANANVASAPFIDQALLKDPGLYPPAATAAKLVTYSPLEDNVAQEIDRIWSKLSQR
jgi:spermidine/putrescine-binding protein